MTTDKTPKVYLSKRNLLALLSKLERDASGDDTACTIIKYQQPLCTEYRQTMDTIAVIAVQDEDYYGAQNRRAGKMHPADEAAISKFNEVSERVGFPDRIPQRKFHEDN